jgi:chromosome partitioning protein
MEQHAVREFLVEVRDRYDFVLIDCPWERRLLSWAALIASDGLIVPVEPDAFETDGIRETYAMADDVRARINPGLRLLGCLLNRVIGVARMHRIIEQRLRRMYGADFFATTVPSSTAISLANHKGKPVAEVKPRSAATQSMKTVAEETDWRLAGRTCSGPRGGYAESGWRPADRFDAKMEVQLSGAMHEVR